MKKKLTNATVIEMGGAWYPVLLDFIPRVGEYIVLSSAVDLRSGDYHIHRYVVEHVIHTLGDHTKENDEHQFVEIFVRTADFPKGLDLNEYPQT